MTRINPFKQIADNINVQPLVDAISEHESLWLDVEARQLFEGSPHVDTQTIFVRGPRRMTRENYQETTDAFDAKACYVLEDALREVVTPILIDILDLEELGRILIVKLKSGGVVDLHTDQGVYAEHFERWHLVLTTNAGCIMCNDGFHKAFAVGELWSFDHQRPHSACNMGDDDRIHLIIDGVRKEKPYQTFDDMRKRYDIKKQSSD